MTLTYQNIKYPSATQVVIWQLKRAQHTGKRIAEQKQISPASVSKFLKEANARVLALLKNAAKMNKIHLELNSARFGFARGYSHVFNVPAYITYSPVNGVNVWYHHEGTCEACDDFTPCRKSLIKEFEERNIEVPDDVIRPTFLAEIIFEKIEKMIKK